MSKGRVSESERELQGAARGDMSWRTAQRLDKSADQTRPPEGETFKDIEAAKAAETERRTSELRAARENAANSGKAVYGTEPVSIDESTRVPTPETTVGAVVVSTKGSIAAPVTPDAGLGSALPVKIGRVKPYEGQPRKFFDEQSLRSLADSIQSEGQQVPIKVCRAKVPGEFILVDGERRWRAHKLIWERTGVEPTILCLITVVKDIKDHFRQSVVANLHREDISALDEAAALHMLKEDGESVDSLCRLIGKSVTYVNNYIRLHTLPTVVKEMMSSSLPKNERLSVTSAIDIAASTKVDALRIGIAKEVLARDLGVHDTRALIVQRTGVAGYQPGGFKRKPSEDYKVYSGFLARTATAATRMARDLNLETMYDGQEDDFACFIRDERSIDNIIIDLTKWKEEIKRLRSIGDAP